MLVSVATTRSCERSPLRQVPVATSPSRHSYRTPPQTNRWSPTRPRIPTRSHLSRPPIPGAQARKLGCGLLTLAMEQRHQIGLDSYDRLFPNQDILPKGGFGNLIALPLQRAPRQEGNSVFLDQHFEPYPDQWALL